jgi:hypothetical protein
VTLSGIAAERRDVRLNPAQRGNLVLQAVISRRAFAVEFRMRQKPEHADAIVDADDDGAQCREPGSVADGLRR